MTLGKRLKDARKSQGYTQESLASKVRVSRGVITNLERDMVENPQPLFIENICETLNINEEWLITGNGRKEREVTLEEITYSQFGKAMEKGSQIKKNITMMLMAMVDKVPDDEWDYIYNVFQECLQKSKKRDD